MLGLPRRPREPPGGPRRQQEAAQEAPGNPLGSPRSRRRRQEGAEVPQTTQFAWFGDVEVPQTTVFTWFLATEMPKTTLSEGGTTEGRRKVNARLTQG